MSKQKSITSKAGLQSLQSPLDASSFHNGLILAGLMEIIHYESSTGSGEIKYYLSLTKAAELLGRNAPSGWHEFKTEPRFFEQHFVHAYMLSVQAIVDHANQIAAKINAD